MLVPLVLLFGHGLAQTTNGSTSSADDATGKQWSFSLSTLGYLVPQDQSYGSPVFTADHRWLHLEARYNYGDQETGSLWAGYNFGAGHRLELEVTPMLGAVFGNTTGIAPGCELAVHYKKVELSVEAEYVYAPSDSKNSFFYSWNELVYSPTDWFHAGLVSQRTRAYHTPLDLQRGFSAGFSHKQWDFTTYVLNAGWTQPTVVLALRLHF